MVLYRANSKAATEASSYKALLQRGIIGMLCDDKKRLLNPSEFQELLDISGSKRDILIKQLEMMKRIRKAEVKLAEMKRDGFIGGPIHLGVGQEAVATGIAQNLKKTDRVFGAHRSHSHVLSAGSDVGKLFAEILGKETGLSKGMGGSMHLWDAPNGFFGSVPIVAGTVPLAVGAGLAAKLQKTNDIAVAYLGDGAVEEGIVHESLNLARVHNIPVVFVVENNLFASHMDLDKRQPLPFTSRFAEANNIEYALIDGNDITEINKASSRLTQYCRDGKGPAFIEAITYRWYGHVDWREDIDVGVNRSQEDVKAWKKRCPIARLEKALLEDKALSLQDIVQMDEFLDDEINRAWQFALDSEYPAETALLERVYFNEQ